jgi:hypothetical protein
MIYLVNRNAAPVSEQPEECLTRWRISRAPDGERQFVGLRANGHTIRLSSPIVQYDPQTQTGQTVSGRRYRLIGPPQRGWNMTDLLDDNDIRLRALVICRSRDPGTPICTDAPCAMCLDEARKELLRERDRQ